MLFSFKAIRKSGESYEGTAEASDRYALARQLKKNGDTLVSVEETTKREHAWLNNVNAMLAIVRTRDKILFARNLGVMIAAGLSISRGLAVMERQTKNKRLQVILKQLGESVQQGQSLSASLATFPKVFPPFFVSMVKSGEESGKLSESLAAISEQMDRMYQLKRKIRGAMIYPSVVVTAMIVVGIVMLIFVVPTLTSTFEELGIELPRSTQLIIAVSDFLTAHTIVSLTALVAVIVGLITGVRTSTGKRLFEQLLLHTPLIGTLVRETNAARTARTLASLLVAGVEVVAALGITRDVVQNTQFRKVIAEAEENIQKGTTMSEIFSKHENLYPVMFTEMMSVGEEVGDLSSMLNDVAAFYEDEVAQKTKNLSTIIEPFLIIIIGIVVGFFAVSMISPIYSISSGI